MIPLMGVTTCNRLDHMKKLIESINFPIDTLSILVNSDIEYFDQVRNLPKSPFVNNVEYSLCPQNMGCGPSWNYHIKHYPSKDYWVLCSDDVRLGKNDLKQICDLIVDHDGVFGDKDCEYILFALNRNMIRKVGLFDENIFPACYEDNDYRKRISMSDTKITHFNISAYHNDGPAGSPTGCGTSSKFSSEKLNRLRECIELNGQYFSKKWGREFFPIDEWTFDIDERSKKEFRI